MSEPAPTDRKSKAIEIIKRAAEVGKTANPDPRSLPPIESIQDAAKELGQPDPTTCAQKGEKGDYTISPDNSKEIGKKCGRLLDDLKDQEENAKTSKNIGSSVSEISQQKKSSPKKKMFTTSLPALPK